MDRRWGPGRCGPSWQGRGRQSGLARISAYESTESFLVYPRWVTVAEVEVHLNDAAIYDLLNGADGPVAKMLDELSERAAAVARANVPVRKVRPGFRHVRGFNTA